MITKDFNSATLKPLYSKIFRTDDPFDKIFVSSHFSKIILYPTNGYLLSEKQFIALTNTLKIFNDPIFYISEVEGNIFAQHNSHSMYKHKHIKVGIETSYGEYEQEDIIIENTIYSSHGNWGIIISHEEHAVLGGQGEFIETFKAAYPDYMNDQKKFIEAMEYWSSKQKKDSGWLKQYIYYINNY